ncbi:MAG TPA: selenocysteine-specific translation elongation factor [Gemmatimonadaceae bacterium]
MILGTAGHIDHGKTTLVRALTGVDTDRLPEERRRGITIELGFAPLELPGIGTVGVVDVPGHEAFVRTMLAGATGIDLALLVVAADEGVMPQTREHLAILSLLGVRGGVVALTKCDLVEEDWLALVEEDVRAALAAGPLAGAPIVRTAAARGEGLDAVREAIGALAASIPARDASDLFRMPVDRAFTVRGTGTVVTGTIWSGSLGRDAVVRILPGGRTARVRGTQSHGAPVNRAGPGSRAAVALAGIELEEAARGSVLVEDASWQPTRILRAEVALLDDAGAELGPRTRVRLHLGTADVGARVVAAGGRLRPGVRTAARVVLDEPVVARAGDRFVLRSASPLVTIGGGVVQDPQPHGRRVRPWPSVSLGAGERLALLLAEGGARGVAVASLPVRLGVAPAAVGALLAQRAGAVRVLGDHVYDPASVADLGASLRRAVAAYHAEHPLEPGAPLQAMRASLGAPAAIVEEIVRDSVRAGALELDGGLVRERGWVPRLTDAQRERRDALLALLEGAGAEPPSVPELSAGYGSDAGSLLRLLEREGRVVQVEPDRYYAAGALGALLDRLRGGMAAGREYGPAELRDLLGISRKYLIPLLEYCDRTGVTDRRATGRSLRGT